MRILQICAAYKPAFIYGGPTMSVAMLSEQLTKAGIYIEAYATTANGKEELPVNPGEAVNVDGVKVTYFKRLTKDHSHFSPALLKKLWKEARGFDVIHIHAWWNLVSVFSCLIALLRSVPIVISPRGTLSPYSFQNKNIGKKWLIHHLLGRPLLNRCHIHVTSNQESEAIYALIKPKRISNLPNFVKLPADLPGDAQSLAIFKLIFLSRIEEKKGLDILINALPFLNFPYSLTIAGSGDKMYVDELKAVVKKNGDEADVYWIGFQGDNKFELLAQHHLLVLPSYDENFGNVVIESLSQGTAVLISPFVGLADYVNQNNLGWECELNAISVGNMINFIHGKKDELNRIRLSAPEIIRADFNEAHLTKQYTDMYNNVING
ncbi:XrtY-associated glycosyltransferase XYAG1 [Mucilaginibacter sp. OK098]|uniref:XrtY-associated glycosyltransferase XYAG1 n=1 Tax=Mucilaginibacter sp. OK098 TaxID=1855297 RepID=UPI00091A4959|nr:glycosyltransferase [Mucilaginibacter sp. OK098]SHN23928.1 Glycosyltransferase involved in cell wall bisynthesis [Mucilaginibacter sp. OK098]